MMQKSKSRMGPKTQKAMDTQASSGRGKAVADGFKKFASEVKSIPGNIARDVKMGASAGVFSGPRQTGSRTLRAKIILRQILKTTLLVLTPLLPATKRNKILCARTGRIELPQ
jgi:hypothetical protein